jgi:hypothetical protein
MGYLMTSNMAYRLLTVAARHGVAITRERVMKKDRKETNSSEPLGIIISRGDKTEPTPVFSAYIWGPVPESELESANRAA